MSEKHDELRLNLSLGLGGNQNPLKRNLFMAPPHDRKTSWNDMVHLSDGSSGTRTLLRGIDVNAVPSHVDGDDDTGASSPNSTLSSISGKRAERESNGNENEGERASTSHGGSDDEDGNGGCDTSRKKLRLSKEQALVLEETFKDHSTLNPKKKQALAKQLNLMPRQVEVWFQNRRARTKLKQTEVDCEYMKRCCENLTTENRRLQKEVQELRALKLSPQHYMQMNPPTTLTMCPSCERVAVSSSSSAAASFSMTGANCSLTSRDLQRGMPVSPWAALPIHRPPLDAQSSQP